MKAINEAQLDNWWRHNGIYDRIQASNIWATTDVSDYLRITDDWWFSRTKKEKIQIYKDFFNENE